MGVAGRRRLGDRVAARVARVQPGEAVLPAGVGRGRLADGVAELIGAGERDGGAGDRRYRWWMVVRLPAGVVLDTR